MVFSYKESHTSASCSNTNIIWLHPCNPDSMIFETVPLLYSCLFSVNTFYVSLLWTVACWLAFIFLPWSIYGKLFKSTESFVWCYITIGCIMLLNLSRSILQLFPAFGCFLFFVVEMICVVLYAPSFTSQLMFLCMTKRGITNYLSK